MSLYNRHVGFNNVSWIVSLDYCIALNWTTEAGEVQDLKDDDVVGVSGFLPGFGQGEITLTGRRAGLIQPGTYFGRVANLTASLIEGTGVDSPGTSSLTLKNACLIGVGVVNTTNGLTMRTLTFRYTGITATSSWTLT